MKNSNLIPQQIDIKNRVSNTNSFEESIAVLNKCVKIISEKEGVSKEKVINALQQQMYTENIVGNYTYATPSSTGSPTFEPEQNVVTYAPVANKEIPDFILGALW